MSDTTDYIFEKKKRIDKHGLINDRCAQPVWLTRIIEVNMNSS